MLKFTDNRQSSSWFAFIPPFLVQVNHDTYIVKVNEQITI